MTVPELELLQNPPGNFVKMKIPKERWLRRIDHPALFLTYDDGPNPAVTPQLLDMLKSSRASATFFVTGEALNRAEAPSILQRTLAEGHTIGNHGQLHLQNAYPEFEVSQRRIENACGIHTEFFRAPHGLKTHVSNYLRRDRRVLGIHWTQCLEDWLPVDLSKIEKQIPEIVKPGSIVLLHDGSPSTDLYTDRSQVLKLTEMILAECRRKSIPLAGLASVYPKLHRVRSASERLREDKSAKSNSSIVGSIAAAISILKQRYGS